MWCDRPESVVPAEMEGVKGVTESAASSGEGLEGEEGLAIWVLGSIPFLAVARIKDGSSPASLSLRSSGK
jgi:hypothetical protein